MGRFFMWLQKDNVAELKIDREKLIKKRDELNEEITAIDERIKTLECKDKGCN